MCVVVDSIADVEESNTAVEDTHNTVVQGDIVAADGVEMV
jgi:hypothetical protein